MRLVPPLVPCLATAALAACSLSASSSVSGAHIVIDKHLGWSGTAEVFVHAPDGSMQWRVPVNDSVDVSIDDGDTVSVAFADAGRTRVVSSLDVRQGDALELQAYSLADVSYLETTVNLPALSGASTWTAATPSSFEEAFALPAAVQVPADDASVPIVAAAETFDSVLEVHGAPDAPIAADQSITLTSPLAWNPVAVTVQNPGPNSLVRGALHIEDGSLALPSAGGIVAVPTGFGVPVEIGAAGLSSSGTDLDTVGQTFGDPPTGPITVDLSVPDLPAIGVPTVANGRASWTVDGGGAYDLIQLELGTPSAAGAVPQFAWILQVPPGTASIVLPQLPSDLAAPASFAQAGIIATERSDVDGYDDALHAMPTAQPGSRWEVRTVSSAL